MEDHVTKMNMFSSDPSNDFTDGIDAGEPLIVVICHCCNMKDLKKVLKYDNTIKKQNLQTFFCLFFSQNKDVNNIFVFLCIQLKKKIE